MNEIYWITRLDALEDLFQIVCFLSLCAFIVSLAFYLATLDDEDYNKKCASFLKKSTIPLLISILLLFFVPNSKQAVMIWGVGGTIDYIKSNDTAKQLPDKCIQALDKFVDEYMLNEEDNKEE